MNEPKVIYLNVGFDKGEVDIKDEDFEKLIGISWSDTRINDQDLKYELSERQTHTEAKQKPDTKALRIGDFIRTYNRRFKLYLKVESDMKSYEMHRGSGFGIATADDEDAKKWQSLQMRRELLKSFLEGENPNWWFADYLPREERDRRNQTYCV